MKRLVWWVLILVGCYLVLALAVFLLQDRMLFPGGRGGPVPKLPGVTIDVIQMADGGSCRCAIAEPEGKRRGVLLFFVGNGEDLVSGVQWARCFAEYGYATLVPEYPGYGESDGAPGKESILVLADLATQRVLQMRHGDEPLVVGGISLGSCSAVHVAATLGDTVDRLLLLAPLATIKEIAESRFGWLPIGWMLRHPFDNLSQASRVKAKALVLHGDADQVVPVDHGRRLAAAMPNAELQVVPGKGHMDLWVGRAGPFGELMHRFLGR